MDFAASNSEESLKALADACEPASFGVGGQDVLDESYRKAGKMDAENFASQFSPLNHHFVRLINKNFFKSLNAYGPGSFFKARVDTPRSTDIFGSLVVVLPTKHEGGALLFRHGERKSSFDSAKAVESADPTALKTGFAIFYSDVEHEVTPIVSGYRVTLTYNIYFRTRDMPTMVRDVTIDEVSHHLKALLEDDAFLPEGGLLGFKLFHKYPVSDTMTLADTSLKLSLKGPDRCIALALKDVKVKTTLRIFYEMDQDDHIHYMFDTPLKGKLDESCRSTALDYAHENKGIYVRHLTLEECYNTEVLEVDDPLGYGLGPSIPVHWVTDTKSGTRLSKSYIAYGNQPTLAYFYGEIAIVAHIGPKGSRHASKSINLK